jgi:hypothetical protein
MPAFPQTNEIKTKDKGRQECLPHRCVLLLCLTIMVGSSGARAAHPAEIRTVQSKYYLLHSDLDDALLYDLGTRMDAMYVEYSRRLADFDLREDRKPLDAYLFNKKSDYTTFTDSRYLHTGGVFMAAKNQLAAYLDGQRDTLRRTLQHEAFHQFAYKAIGANMPIWLNEGMAQLFEEAIWTGDSFLMNQVPPRRIRQLQSDIENNNLLSFKILINMSPEKWSGNLAGDPAVGSTQYNQAWAVVHYMAYGDGGKNGARLVTLLKALGKGQDAEGAFRDSFGGNLETFRARFESYALALQPTPEASLIDRHDVLADLCGQLSAQGKRFPTVLEFRKAVEVMKYRLRYTRGEVSWTAEPASYFRDNAGVAFAADQLYFEPRKSAPLPDLVFSHPAYRIALRARFFKDGEKIEHEVLVEPGPAGTTANIER